MMKHLRIEILILLFTVILIISVVITGSETFNNLGKIEKQSEKIYKPNKTIFSLKLLLSELRNAENSMKSYSLFNNSEYLMNYLNSLEQIKTCFDRLHNYQKNNPEARALLDITENLVEQKIALLYRQLSLRDEEKVIDELKRINVKLKKVAQADTIVIKAPETVPEKKRSFFNRLFGHKPQKKAKEVIKDSVRIVLNMGSVEDVKKEVKKVKKKQINLFAEMNGKEFALINEDKIIWQKLLSILTQLENRQNDLLKAIAGENINETNKTHRLTETFGILILMLLAFLLIFSLYYFYSGRKYRKELQASLNSAKLLAKARENFLATMSHEMRTPLNAISGFTEQLQSSEIKDSQKEQLNIISSASKHLLNLINDVLDLSKIEAEKIFFEKITFNPVIEIREALSFLQTRISDKKLKLYSDFSANIPPAFTGDPLRLKQVVLNLLSNSVKFTETGFIKIGVSTLQNLNGDDSQAMLCITVEDSGIGVSPDMLEEIFENFTQADSSITRKYGGSGLGLSITKKIVEMQYGEIKIESKINEGSKVTVKIPYGVNSPSPELQKSCDQKYISELPKGKKILIADDEEFNRALLISILKRWDIGYEEAQNGKEVLEKLDKNNYDLILMDVRMPEMDGIDACRQIRKLKSRQKSGIPIIGITAGTSFEKKELCLKAGMNKLITKPYKEHELIKVIRSVL
jgi:signal transduction histidine kinase/CheY-like chemotaxis protein/CHASE3 domain sensor protein